MSEPDPTYRIALVHGTFARGAPWTHEGSRLCTGLESRLGGAVVIERCQWSGGNTAGARAAGAQTLARHLRTWSEKPPHEHRFVVAHSHGGNVALYALRDPEVARLVDGLVCMATPFLVARRRDLGPRGIENLVFVFLVATVALWWWLIKPRLPDSIGAFGHALFVGVLAAVAAVLVALLIRSWDRMADRLLTTLGLAALPSRKLLILRATGDEASALLLFFQFISLLAVRLFHSMQGLYSSLERRFENAAKNKAMLLAVIAAGIVLVIVVITILVQAGALKPLLVALFVFVLALTVVVPGFLLFGAIGPATACFRFVAALAVLPAALALALCMLPIDWRVALANLLVDVTVETAPPGRWEMQQFVPQPREPGQDSAPGLAHSAIYDDPRAVDAIVDWMRGAARAPDSAS